MNTWLKLRIKNGVSDRAKFKYNNVLCQLLPSAKLKKMGVTKEKFDSCLSKVGDKPGVNKYAVCNSSLGKKKSKK